MVSRCGKCDNCRKLDRDRLREVVRKQAERLDLLQADMAGDVNVWPGFTDSVRVIEAVLRAALEEK